MIKLHIEVYSHYFKCFNFDAETRKHVTSFTGKQAQLELVPNPDRTSRRKYIYELKKIFAGFNKRRTEFRFHRNQLDAFIEHLKVNGYYDRHIDIKHIPLANGTPVKFELTDKRSPRDYQVPYIDYLAADDRKENEVANKILILQTGKGKLQPLSSKIKVPGGWSTMGEMQPGTIISMPDGTTAPVSNIYPHGVMDVYKVEFEDGRFTYAGAEHLWEVFYVNTVKHKRWRVVNTLEVLRLISMPNPRVYVRLIEPNLHDPVLDLPLDPYLLGVLLGDGHLGKTVTIAKNDFELFEKIKDKLPKEHVLSQINYNRPGSCLQYAVRSKTPNARGTIIPTLVGLGLAGKLSHEKFVPAEYKDASYEQRLEMIRGLLDTDGSVSHVGTVSFVTTSKQLAEDMVYLIRSIGGLAKISEKTKYFSYKGDKKKGRLAYQVNIRVKSPKRLFTLKRKRDMAPEFNQYSSSLKLRVKGVSLSHQEETQCIEVDHKDHLYITDDFIVTHNTFVSLQSIFRIGQRVLLTLTRETYIHKWKDDVKNAYGLDEDDIYILQGRQSILELSHMAKDDRINPIKFIICSTRTLSDFIKFYEDAETEQEVVDAYGMLPDQIWETCGIGCRFIDEVHEHFHSVFKLDMYTHVPYAISLTATLLSDSPFVERQMVTAFPHHIRPKPTPFDQYIDVMAYFYTLSPGHKNKVRYKQPGRGSYSHVALEKSILKDKEILTNYMMIIERIMKEKYFGIREGGQKLIIFASTINMCNMIVKAFKQRYPAEDIRKYTAEDKYEDLMAAKIIVATPGSAGTAVDIPDLLTAICTVNVRSKVANVQMLGRLRRLEDYPDTAPQFTYLVCDDIRAHLDYHDHKMKLFRDKARQHGEDRIGILL